MPPAKTSPQSNDYDSPWKEMLDRYFLDFLGFFFPAVHAGIDWSRGYEFLDKELQRVVRNAASGRRHADKLVKVFLVDGHETWLLIHIEIQGYQEPHFAERMYVYNYRIFDRYHVEVVSLALCTIPMPKASTKPYQRRRWGCELTFRFPVAFLHTYRRRWAALEANANPFAVIVMAHLTAQRVPPGEERKAWKMRLIRGLYGRGLPREDILELFRFIDWLLVLPAALEPIFLEELRQWEEEHAMPYVSSVERYGFEKGQLQEARTAVLEVLTARFPDVPEDIIVAIERLEALETLHALLRRAVRCPSIAALRDILHTV